jgi:hypothetical protein
MFQTNFTDHHQHHSGSSYWPLVVTIYEVIRLKPAPDRGGGEVAKLFGSGPWPRELQSWPFILNLDNILDVTVKLYVK